MDVRAGMSTHVLARPLPTLTPGAKPGQKDSGVVWQVGAKDWGLILTCP